MQRNRDVRLWVLAFVTACSLALAVFASLMAISATRQANEAMATITAVQSLQAKMQVDWNDQYSAFTDAINLNDEAIEEIYANQEVIAVAVEGLNGGAGAAAEASAGAQPATEPAVAPAERPKGGY